MADRTELPPGYQATWDAGQSWPYVPELSGPHTKSDAIAACWAHHDAIAAKARAEERAAIVADARDMGRGTLAEYPIHDLADRWERGDHIEPKEPTS